MQSQVQKFQEEEQHNVLGGKVSDVFYCTQQKVKKFKCMGWSTAVG